MDTGGTKRRDTRAPTETRAYLRILSLPGHPRPRRLRIECRTTDVSKGGTRITLTGHTVRGADTGEDIMARLVPGATGRVILLFQKPRKKFKLDGVVRWVQRNVSAKVFVLGIEFTSSSPRSLEAWKRFTSDRSKNDEATVKLTGNTETNGDPW